jgi:nucleotide-binding universal stress UspA family protein
MYKVIVFPIDIHTKNSWAESAKIVAELALLFKAKLYLVTVVPNYGLNMVQQYFPKGWVEEITAKAKSELEKIAQKEFSSEIEIECLVEMGTIYEGILSMADKVKADLITIPAHRPELRDYLLGPNSAKVARHAQISVLILRS